MPEIALVLFAYRQLTMIDAAIDSAFAQEGEPLDIILSDDCSPDQTGEIMARRAAEYRGPHKVRYRSSKHNLGAIEHMQEAIAEANAELVILQAGDDISLPNRARTIAEAWRAHGKPTCVICSEFHAIDTQGLPCDSEAIAQPPFTLMSLAQGKNGPIGATCAISRSLVTDLPPIPRTVVYEDRVIPFRALLTGGEIIFLPEKLVRYRVEGGISRGLPNSMPDYLFRYCRDYGARKLEDARQRLLDAEAMRPDDKELIKACRATAADEASKVAMSDGRSLTRKYILALLDGARFIPLTKHYLKAMAFKMSRPLSR